MKMNKRMYGLVVGAMVLALGACGTHDESDQQSGPKEVSAIEVRQDSVEFTMRAPAQLHGKQDIAIVPQVSATIEKVLVAEGDRVTKGQVMFVLNQSVYLAAVDNAKAAVTSAEMRVETQELQMDAKQQLFDKNIISEHEYKVQQNNVQIARAGLEEAKAQLRAAETNLGYTVIRAPHTGVVGTINYKQGALVGPQITEPMTIVSDNSTVYAYMSMNGNYYLYYLKLYGSKEAMIEQLEDFSLILGRDTYYAHPGRMETISGIIDRSTGAVSARIAFPNPEGILTAGGAGQVELKYKSYDIALPRTAVFSIQNKDYVYVLEPTKTPDEYTLNQTMVEVTRLSETMYAVTGGLQNGQLVISEGVKKMTNGDKVKFSHAD